MRETAAALLQAARKALIEADIEGSSLDARVLLQSASSLSHEELVAHPDAQIEVEAVSKFQNFIERRLLHEPVSRILGWREFYGRNFLVTPAVLDPRPDTETLVDLILQRTRLQHKMVLDLGAGSGAIVITLLAELARLTGTAVDLSQEALDVVDHNATVLGVAHRLQLHNGFWFQGLTGTFDLIVSNPPYIVHSQIEGLGAEVKHFDPHLALDGGDDGLTAYRHLAKGAPEFLAKGGVLAVEIGAGQSQDVADIFTATGFTLIEKRKDLSGHDRALAFEKINDSQKKPL